MRTKYFFRIGLAILILILAGFGIVKFDSLPFYEEENSLPAHESARIDINSIPPYSEYASIEINANEPNFTAEELSAAPYEHYSPLDSLGRVGVAMAMIGTDLMPTEERESIREIKPTGWHQKQYDFVGGKSLYNRCHLIAYQLTGEGKNKENLMTGTRYFNVEGMLPYENIIADYIRETDNHVLYRVSPVFSGDNLLADGAQLEVQSVEDGGAGVRFNVFCYNVEPGVIIDYTTGENEIDPNYNPDVQNY